MSGSQCFNNATSVCCTETCDLSIATVTKRMELYLALVLLLSYGL